MTPILEVLQCNGCQAQAEPGYPAEARRLPVAKGWVLSETGYVWCPRCR